MSPLSSARSVLILRGRQATDRAPGLFLRLLILAALFTSELIVVSVLVDGAALLNRGGLMSLVGAWGAWILKCLVGFAAIFVTFAYLKNKPVLNRISGQVSRIRVRRAVLAAHFLAILVFGGLSYSLYAGNQSGFRGDLIAIAWLSAGVSAIAFAAFAFVPLLFWVQIVRAGGYLWAYALIGVILACLSGNLIRSLWQPASHLTFGLVRTLLTPLVSGVIADAASMTVGTQRFSVEIAPECSGFEGAGLMLAFGITWLWLFRHECRFPHALLLIPVCVALLFLLNAVRIAMLVLIGDAGAPQIALGGFHSQAGWIAFNAAALGLSAGARRVPWLNTKAPEREASSNPAAAYLAPFLTILAVGMICGAMTADFEWLYPLRFFAAAGALWFFRREYSGLDWKFGPLAPAIGALVFVIWIAIVPATSATPPALTAASTLAQITWITFRVLAAVITVPIAEELAFRGFLMRRLISPDFQLQSLRSYTWFGLVVSSVAFGLLHSDRWFSGTLAGLLYALVMVRRGRFGDAVVAHATTNALLAGYVLIFHQWRLW